MGLVWGILGFSGDSTAGESGISGIGDFSLGLQGDSGIGYIGNSCPGLWGSLSSGLLACDNSSGLGGESASVSAVSDSCSSKSELVGDSSPLKGKGMDTLLSS